MAHRLVWMPTDEILKKVPCTCIDGRTQGIRYSVAGGSFGLFLHILATVQRAHGRCKQALVERFLRAIDQADLLGLDQSRWADLISTHNTAAETTLNTLAPELPVDHIRL